MAHPVSAWTCAFLILGAGALGGIVNAFLTDNGFVLSPLVKVRSCVRGLFRTYSSERLRLSVRGHFMAVGLGYPPRERQQRVTLTPRSALGLLTC